eukprot:jgi/Undpi1/13101/HiC_scaffold_8.g02763.m1
MPRRRSSSRRASSYSNEMARGTTRRPVGISSSSSSSSRRESSISSSRSSQERRFKMDSGDEDDRRRRRRDCKKRFRGEVVSSACRYTQAEVTPGNRGVLAAAACSRQLHADFDQEHQDQHKGPRAVERSPPGNQLENNHMLTECSSSSTHEEHSGGSHGAAGGGTTERSSSANEARCSGQSHTPGRGTTESSKSHASLKAAGDTTRRIDGDTGSSKVHGGLQQTAGDVGRVVGECIPAPGGLPREEDTTRTADEPAGDGGRVGECTPAQRGLPGKEETTTTATVQTNGPAEVMPNRDTEREPPTWVSNVFQSESGIGSDSTAQPGSVDEKNSGSIGGVAREGTKKEVTRTSPQEQNKEEEEESRGKYAAEGGKGEGVSKEVNGASSFQEAYRDVNSTSGLREEDDNKAAVFYPDKSKREADDPDCHAAVAREGRKLMASGEAQEEKDECLRKSVDGGQEETEGGNDGGKERGGSKAGGGRTGGVEGGGGKAGGVEWEGGETRSTQAQGTDIPANPEGDAAGKLSTSLSHGGSDEDEESLSGHQNEAAMQTKKGPTHRCPHEEREKQARMDLALPNGDVTETQRIPEVVLRPRGRRAQLETSTRKKSESARAGATATKQKNPAPLRNNLAKLKGKRQVPRLCALTKITIFDIRTVGVKKLVMKWRYQFPSRVHPLRRHQTVVAVMTAGIVAVMVMAEPYRVF